MLLRNHLFAIHAIALTTLREALRARLLYALLAFGIGVILLSAVLSNLTLGWRVRVVTDLALAAVSISGLLMAVLLGVASPAKDFDRRTSYSLLGKSITRMDYVLGKYIGVVSACWLVIGAMLLMATALIASYHAEGGAAYGWHSYFLASLFLFLRIAIAVSIAVTLSLIVSPTVAVIASIGMVVAGYSSHQLRYFLGEGEGVLGRLLAEGIYFAVPDFAILDPLEKLIHGQPVASSSTWIVAVYGSFYILTLLLLSGLAFTRRDMQ